MDKNINMNEIEEKSATFDHLVVLLMSSDLILFDKSFVLTFFLSSRIFMSPRDLLKNILEKTFYFILHHRNITKAVINKCISRFIYILNQWAVNFPSDFRDVNVICTLRSVQDKFVSLDDSFAEDFNHLFTFLAKQISDIESFEKNLILLHHESKSKLSKKLSDLNILNVCDDPFVLAKQLTYIELERLKHISPDEFLNYFINSSPSKAKQNSETAQISDVCQKNFRLYLDELKQACKKDILIEKTNFHEDSFKCTSNLLASISWFNRCSAIVSTEIVKSSQIDKRVEIVHFFIDTALNCYKIGNYNSLMAIIAGLQSYPVSRLRQTWNNVEKSKWEKLTFFSDPLGNYRNYRNLLKTNRQKKATRFYIPAFSILMKDLNFYFNNLSTITKKNLIGLSKFWEISKYLIENLNKENIDKASSINNNFINSYLLTEPLLREDACLYLSFKCEKPVNEPEINRQKHLCDKLTND